MNRILEQGGIYLCNLDPIIGSEQGGKRPCIVVSNNMSCMYSPTVTIVPITSQSKKPMVTHMMLSKARYRFLVGDENLVLCEQIRTIDKSRIGGFIGRVRDIDLKEIIDRINEHLSV